MHIVIIKGVIYIIFMSLDCSLFMVILEIAVSRKIVTCDRNLVIMNTKKFLIFIDRVCCLAINLVFKQIYNTILFTKRVCDNMLHH